MRISYDGRRLASFAVGSVKSKYSGYDVLERKQSSTDYALPSSVAGSDQRSDLVFHPLLPIAIVAGGGEIEYLDANSGQAIPGKPASTIPNWQQRTVQNVMVSASGKQLVILAGSGTSDRHLVRAELPLTSEELTAMQTRAAAPPPEFKAPSLPLADLTHAGRWEFPSRRQTAEIAAEFSDAVVIVRSDASTGTGFVVGSSGIILTCAHCVSPLDGVEVEYHPRGKPDEKKTAEATIIRRDRKLDLALLRIDVSEDLHAVTLADPLKVKSGEDVTIIANPGLGTEVLESTVTTGIVSNAQRIIEGRSYIQSSAAVNPGSSGGAMFDRQGRVIGVVVLKAGLEGVGFAVPPIPTTTFLLQAASRDGEQGQLLRKWTDTSGARGEVEARLVAIDKDSVTLAKAGSLNKTKNGPGALSAARRSKAIGAALSA